MPAKLRTKYRGAISDWELEDPETGEHKRFRVAYIHSSEEAAQVAAARERALSKAEEQLRRVYNGLGGRYYKTSTQVERRVGQIVDKNIQGLITVNVAAPNGKPTLSWERNRKRSSTPHAPTGSTRWRPTLRAADRWDGATPLQRPRSRRTPPPRSQTDTQGPPDLPA